MSGGMSIEEYAALEARVLDTRGNDTEALARLMKLALTRSFLSRRATEMLTELGVAVAA